MEPTRLLSANYLDIIFDNRNKTYGGYELRSNYERRMKKAAGVVLLGASALLSFSFINAGDGLHIATPKGPIILSQPPVPPPLPTPPVTPPPAQLPQPQNLKTAVFNVPKVIEDDVVPDQTMTEVKDLHNVQVGNANTDGDDVITGPAIVSGPATGTGVAGSAGNSNVPFNWVQQMPEFTGDMSEYLSNHLHYPEAARSESIQGQVLIQFVVNEDGSVTNAKVVRSIGGGCDEEALHIVSSMPKWKPGKQNGIAVKVLFTLPIKFLLN